MSRLQWKLFAIGMSMMFGGPILGASLRQFFGDAILGAGILMAACGVLTLLAGTAGIGIFTMIRNQRIRRHGERVIARVEHLRRSGYSNRVPTYEIDARLPDGTMTTLLATTYDTFEPGSPLALLVDPRHPGHAIRAPRPPRQPEF